MELIGILIFVFALAHSFYKDHRKKLESEEKAKAKRFDASNQPSRMSENGVNRQRNTRQTQARQTRQTLNRQSTSRGRHQEDKKPKTLADYLAKAQEYIDEVGADAQKSFEEVKAEKIQVTKQQDQRRNANQQNRGQQYAKQNQAMGGQKRQNQHATLKQAEGGQSTALDGEGMGWDESDVYADGRGYSAEGSRSNEGSVPENAMSNGDYFDQETAANVLELGKELQQMDEMYDREADRFDREVGQLFKEMKDPGKDLRVTTESKKKSRNQREILALSNQDNLKRGILLKEILDKPVAKR
ncbi:hypothetical protein [Aerococcus viridans]|uniref:hypothetical protein n=1 Tax=Aerococcus viridans TaxID=1377 RepID=UPI002DBA9E80|nr:hypothetical protein [Aerococcus viridans]MEC1386583.1 hypothetical protein [Aerococcus viridans]